MHQLSTTQGGGLREYAICSIAAGVPLCKQAVPRRCKCWMATVASTAALFAAAVVAHTTVNRGLPSMIALVTMPVGMPASAGGDFVWSAAIPLGVPKCCNFWGLAGQGVVLAQLPTKTVWTNNAPATPVCNLRLPFVHMAIWTIGASPPSLPVGKWFDDNIAHVQIGS